MSNSIKLIFLLVVTLFIAGCEKESRHQLKVGMCQWPGYEPLFLASQMNMFSEDIKIIRFSSPASAYKAFKSGAIDVVGLTSDEILKYADYGESPKIFMVLDISDGADAIVSKPYIKELKDIKGKRVALESSTLAQHILYRALDRVNLTAKDIDIITIEIVEQPRAYSENKADVFVTFEPSKSSMIKNNANVLFDSSMIPNEIMDVLVASSKTYKNHKKYLECLERGWYKALNYINKHPKKAYKAMGSLEGISGDEFESSLVGLKYGTKALNNKLISNKEIINSLQKLQKVMIDKKIIDNKIDLNSLIGR